MVNDQTLIDLREVSISAETVQILRDVSLTVDKGEAVGVFGPNGAGKTTLLRSIATLLPPISGTGTVLGADIASVARYDIRDRIEFVGHSPGLYPEMTLLENTQFVAEARGIDAEAPRHCLEQVGLGGAADRLASRCSHGMQRRTEFARVLMTDPTVLLLDEPHSALDADAVDLVDSLVAMTLERGGAAVLVSHDRDRVAKIVDRTFEISQGTLS
ncbi:MAG: heme ABC exporter ATP-binding protein CcmA [Acidimicrobiia bacterium]